MSERAVADYYVVTMIDDGIERVVVVKPHEDDQTVWGVVDRFATRKAAREQIRQWQKTQAELAK